MQPSHLFTATKTCPNNKYAVVIAGLHINWYLVIQKEVISCNCRNT